MDIDPAGLSSNCIFCKILSGESAAETFYQDERVTVIQDRHPLAPVHFLVIPNFHVASLEEAPDQAESLLGHMMLVARQIAREHGVSQSGYRLVVNVGPHGGQTVFHLHLHVIGGRSLPFKFE